MSRAYYNEETGEIEEDGYCAYYEGYALDDIGLSVEARHRLAEICNQPDYEEWYQAEAILIAEGLYTPEREAQR
jgi:hypothetical protein